MRHFIGLWALFGLLFGSYFAYGQAKDQVLVGQADEAYKKSGAKRLALDLYKQAIELNNSNLKAHYMAGVCYLQTIQKERALPHFLRVQDLTPSYEPGMNIGKELYPDLDYLIGLSYHLGENFDRAKFFYSRLATAIRANKGSRQVRENKALALRILERRLFECETGKQMKANPVSVKIIPLVGPNSPFPDYAPTVSQTENQLIFTSRRPTTATPEVDKDYLTFEDIYVADRVADTGWTEAKPLAEINTERHEATVSQSSDGKRLIIYKDAKGGDLYLSTLKDAVWTKPKPVGGEINSPFRESSGVTSRDGKRLYFSSDRPGGFGGTDIYVSEAQDGDNKWGTPSNLGAGINTEFDDEGPAFSIDGVYLYFSSKGHRGMGGYDIFRTQFGEATQEWSKPENLGYPINTADDDLYYVQGNDIGHAYFASSRESGTGDLDLYLIRPLYDTDSLLIRGPKVADLFTQAKPLTDEKSNILSDSARVAGQKVVHQPAGNQHADTSQSALAREYARHDSVVNGPSKGTSLHIRLSAVEAKSNRYLDVSLRFEDTETGETFPIRRTNIGVFEITVPTDKARSFTASAEKAGFQFRNATLLVQAGENGTKVLDRFLWMEPLAQNRPRILKNLYFDFDKIDLRPASKLELDLLENLMRDNPRLIIEVAGHTDFLGTDAYNQRLSERRAEAVVAYLVKKGIDRSRLRAKGYGKRIPIASNDDEHEGRELNRRTEFEIISGRVE